MMKRFVVGNLVRGVGSVTSAGELDAEFEVVALDIRRGEHPLSGERDRGGVHAFVDVAERAAGVAERGELREVGVVEAGGELLPRRRHHGYLLPATFRAILRASIPSCRRLPVIGFE
jgi:hypothetical protein